MPTGLQHVKIFGADVANSLGPALQYTDPETGSRRPSWMPPWLELKHVCLDNSKSFKHQLTKCGLCTHSAKFDVVLMRQGLCYCEDPSYEVCPPEELIVAGITGEDLSDGPSGDYVLEPFMRNGRPSYRNGKYLLHWRSESSDWAIVEDNETGYVWANNHKESGSPALAQAPWFVWNGEDFVIDQDVSCIIAGACPWKRPPTCSQVLCRHFLRC